MWLQTTLGFFSIVEKPEDQSSGELTIRARLKADLESFRTVLPEMGPITESSHTDYRYRAKAGKQAVAQALASLAKQIDYDNFKEAVAARQGYERAKAYSKVWQALYGLQSKAAEPAANAAARVSSRSSSRPTKPLAFGGVLVREDGAVLLREPAGHYGGYVWTFPKGRPDCDTDTPEACALREVREETGYEAEIVSEVPGVFAGDVTDTRFFLMRPVGEPQEFDSETKSIRWATLDEAPTLIAKTRSKAGQSRDLAVLAAVRQMLIDTPGRA